MAAHVDGVEPLGLLPDEGIGDEVVPGRQPEREAVGAAVVDRRLQRRRAVIRGRAGRVESGRVVCIRRKRWLRRV